MHFYDIKGHKPRHRKIKNLKTELVIAKKWSNWEKRIIVY